MKITSEEQYKFYLKRKNYLAENFMYENAAPEYNEIQSMIKEYLENQNLNTNIIKNK